MSNTTIQKDLKLLEDNFEKKARSFLQEMKDIDEMKVSETLRTAERQKYLIANNKSWVKVSNHQLGKAMDLYFAEKPHYPPSGDKRWVKASKIAKKHGIDCGGVLWGMDWVHFQDDNSPNQEVERNNEKTLFLKKVFNMLEIFGSDEDRKICHEIAEDIRKTL